MVEIPVSQIEPTGISAPAALVKSVAQHGVLVPVLVVEVEPGRYRLVEGRRRVAAALEAGLDAVPARVLKPGAVDEDVALVVTNAHRSPNLVAEAQAVRRLMQRGLGEREIAQALALPLGRVRRLIRWAAVPDDVLEALAQGRVSRAAVEKALRHEWAMEGLRRLLAEKEKVTARDVDDLRRERLAQAAGRMSALLPDLAAFAVAPPAEEEKAEGCTWTPVDDPFQAYETACGKGWPRAYDGAVAVFSFCPFCGQKLTIHEEVHHGGEG